MKLYDIVEEQEKKTCFNNIKEKNPNDRKYDDRSAI
jgi:hypothetical protein